jgi:hypothetical protein
MIIDFDKRRIYVFNLNVNKKAFPNEEKGFFVIAEDLLHASFSALNFSDSLRASFKLRLENQKGFTSCFLQSSALKIKIPEKEN